MSTLLQEQSTEAQPLRLRGRARLISLIGYGSFSVLTLGIFAYSLFARFTQGIAACDSVYHADWPDCAAWFDALGRLGLSAATYESYFLVVRVLAALPFIVLSLLLVRRRAGEVRIVLLAGFLLSVGTAGTWFNPLWEWGGYWLRTYADLPWLALGSNLLTFLLYTGAGIFACTFPDGRFVPRWTRWVAGLAVPIVFAYAFLPDTPLSLDNWPVLLPTLVPLALVVTVVYAVTHRYRYVANSVQRQQIKWIVAGFLLMVLNYLLDFAVFNVYPALTDSYPLQPGMQSVVWELSQDSLSYVSQFVFGLCIGVAVLRHRLWDIDALVSRTLGYGALTVTLATIYLASVVGLQALFTAIAGGRSALAVVISTLAIAALFNPLRRRIQNDIDRLFYRRKYDAQQVLAAFAETARDETDLDRLKAELVHVVEETMQPAHMSLWLKPTANGRLLEEGKNERPA